MNKISVLAISFIVTMGLLITIGKNKTQKIPQKQYQSIPFSPPKQEELSTADVSVKIPYHLNYKNIVEQLKTWEKEVPDLTEVGTYGQSSRGNDLYYIKLTNEKITNKKPTVLITACIHGNEPLATATVMGYIGTILSSHHQKDKEILELMKNREIWFIPLVSPDTFVVSRALDGVDPNRDFPTAKNPNKQSTPSVMALRNFYEKHKFNAVASGHTWGRQYLIPYGDSYDPPPHINEYRQIVGEMASMSNYQMITPKEIYKKAIFGTELDWFYRNGAFAIVIEFGTHQKIPSKADVDEEFRRTYKAILLFMDKAPLLRSWSPSK